METRPKIKLNLSTLDKILEFTTIIFLGAIWILTFYVFPKLPTTIPIHFNSIGHADNYGDKSTLLILPLIATIIYFGLTLLTKYPRILNYRTKITKDNAQNQYTNTTRMLRFTKLAIQIIFLLIILFTYLTTIGVTEGLGNWFLPLTLGLLLTPTFVSITHSLRSRNSVN